MTADGHKITIVSLFHIGSLFGLSHTTHQNPNLVNNYVKIVVFFRNVAFFCNEKKTELSMVCMPLFCVAKCKIPITCRATTTTADISVPFCLIR